MTIPNNITYEITSTKDLPNGGKIVFFNVTRKDLPITNPDGTTKTSTYITATSLYVEPGDDVETRLDEYIAQQPI